MKKRGRKNEERKISTPVLMWMAVVAGRMNEIPNSS
jgi:hypothetical protein